MENKNIDQQLNQILEENKSLEKVLGDAKKKTNPTNLKKGMKQKSIIGAILLLILVLTGTFAWQSYQQRAINPFYDPSGNHGVRFHDRLELANVGTPYFDPSEPYANMVEPNLNIFAENFGDMDVFVRIQLREFFAIHESPDPNVIPDGFGGALRNDPDTWPIFRTSDTNIQQPRHGEVAYDIYREGVRVHFGQDDQLAFMPTFNRAVQIADRIDPGLPSWTADPSNPAATPFFHYNAAMSSEATGAAVDWFTTNQTDDGLNITDAVFMTNNHIRDYIHNGIPTGPGITDQDDNHDPLTVQRRRELDDGSRDNWTAGVDELTSYRIYTDGIAPNIYLRTSQSYYTHTAQYNMEWYVDMTTANPGATLPANFRGVMTYAQWRGMGYPEGDFWIHDSQDPEGWFYWNGYLLQGTNPEEGIVNATSLLVESLQLPDNPLEWEYALYMYGRAFTEQSIEGMNLPDRVMRIFEMANPVEERPLGGYITITATGDIEVTGTIYTIGNLTNASFIATPNALGSVQAAMPTGTDMDLINTPTPPAPWRVDRIGTTIRFSNLPIAQMGCPQTGTPANLWIDSTGIEWCVVADQGLYSMLITRRAHLLGRAPMNAQPAVFWPPTTEYPGGPDIRESPGNGLNAWFNDRASTLLRGATVHANLPVVRTVPGTVPTDAEIAANPAGLSSPITPNSTNGLPFFLSYADVGLRVGASAPARIAYRQYADGTVGAATIWWLREPGHVEGAVPGIGAAGNWGSTAGATAGGATRGVRPGVWVRR